jgi:hypothetical protein
MNSMVMAVGYLRIQGRRIGQAVFRNEAGALTLEWILIAVGLVAAATAAVAIFKTAISNEDKTLP